MVFPALFCHFLQLCRIPVLLYLITIIFVNFLDESIPVICMAVLRIQDIYPGSGNYFISDPGSYFKKKGGGQNKPAIFVQD
jgi:hypothetical protein